MSRTMKGSGRATIKYRNCWNDADSQVIVYLEGVEISRAAINKQYVTFTFDYADGQVVEVKDAGRNSVVEVASF